MELEVKKDKLPSKNTLDELDKFKLLELYKDISEFISYLESCILEEDTDEQSN